MHLPRRRDCFQQIHRRASPSRRWSARWCAAWAVDSRSSRAAAQVIREADSSSSSPP